MMTQVTFSHHYTAPADVLWDAATDYAVLDKLTKGLADLRGLPNGRIQIGQKIAVGLSLFGWFPPKRYLIEILICDHEKMVIQTAERGMGLRHWQHRLSIHPTSTGSTQVDEITIDAGRLTWLYVLWAKIVYPVRHGRRHRMLRHRKRP